MRHVMFPVNTCSSFANGSVRPEIMIVKALPMNESLKGQVYMSVTQAHIVRRGAGMSKAYQIHRLPISADRRRSKKSQKPKSRTNATLKHHY